MEVSPLVQRPTNDFADLLSGLRFFQNNPRALKDAPEDGLVSYLRYTINQLERWGPQEVPGDFTFVPDTLTSRVKTNLEVANQWIEHTPGHVHNIWKSIHPCLLTYVSELEDEDPTRQEPTPAPEGPLSRVERHPSPVSADEHATELASSHPLWVAKTQQERDDVRRRLHEIGVLRPQETESQVDDTDLANTWQNAGEDRIFRHHPDSESTSPEPAPQRRRIGDRTPEESHITVSTELPAFIESDEELADASP